MATVLVFAANGFLIWLLPRDGHLMLYDEVGSHGWVWWGASLVLILVAHDAHFYWTHRALHLPRLFRAAHARQGRRV